MSVLVWLALCLVGWPLLAVEQQTGKSARPAVSQFSAALQLGEDQNVREVVREVLADPEFRRLRRNEAQQELSDEQLPEWIRRFIKWLFNSDEDEAERTARGPQVDISGVLYVLAIVGLVGILTYLIVSMKQRFGSADGFDLPDVADDEALNPTAPPGELPSSEYERRALAYAERGDFRSALRELVLGTMSWIERAEKIRYRRGLTNRDYIRAVWREPPQRESMLLIVASFELVFFGRRLADSSRFDGALIEFRSSFGKEAAHAQMAN